MFFSNILDYCNNKLLFITPLIITSFYDISCLYGVIVYAIYSNIYSESKHNQKLIKFFKPTNSIEPYTKCHRLIEYGFSTIHASFTAIMATLYILQYINDESFLWGLKLSIGYYLADCIVIIDTIKSNKNIKLQDYFTLLHHFIVIYYEILFITRDKTLIENRGLYFFSNLFVAEYSLIPLNYSWYLLHIDEGNSIKFIFASVITLILYFFTRVINITIILGQMWYDDFISINYISIMLIINYYWFYKLVNKAYDVIFNICKEKEKDKKIEIEKYT